MRRAFFILSYVVVVTVGVLAGRMWGTWIDYSQLWDQVAQRDSVEVQTRVTVLSQLRLGRVDDAIEVLEMPLDNQVVTIAFGESKTFHLDPNTMTPTSLKALQMAKAYRSLFPSVETQPDPPSGQIFVQIPDIVFPPKCDGALCELVEKHASESTERTPP